MRGAVALAGVPRSSRSTDSSPAIWIVLARGRGTSTLAMTPTSTPAFEARGGASGPRERLHAWRSRFAIASLDPARAPEANRTVRSVRCNAHSVLRRGSAGMTARRHAGTSSRHAGRSHSQQDRSDPIRRLGGSTQWNRALGLVVRAPRVQQGVIRELRGVTSENASIPGAFAVRMFSVACWFRPTCSWRSRTRMWCMCGTIDWHRRAVSASSTVQLCR